MQQDIWRHELERIAQPGGPQPIDPAQALGIIPERPAAQAAMSWRRMRRRALADAAVLLLAVLIAAQLSASAAELLRNAGATAALGLVAFLWRRRRDLLALARADDWRAEAVRGRGISLADWHAGRSLSPWAERRRH